MHSVFNTASPWINTSGADTNAMIEQVKKCPSGALSFYMNVDKQVGVSHLLLLSVRPANGVVCHFANFIYQYSNP